jgi:hypothetical protein
VSIEIELSDEARKVLRDFESHTNRYVARRDALELAVRSFARGGGTAHGYILERADRYYRYLTREVEDL